MKDTLSLFKGTYRSKLAIIRNIATLLLTFFLLAMSYISFRWSYADILATQVSYHVYTADKDPKKRNVKDWRQAEQYLQTILAIRAEHPQYQEIAERFYQVVDTLETEAPMIVKELGWNKSEYKAIDHARQGLQLMPTWPYLWKQLVLSKVTLKQFDNELTSAIAKAVQLGAWEKRVQYEIAMIGLENWEHLSLESQIQILFSIENMLNIKPDKRYDVKVLLTHNKIVNACVLNQVLPEAGFIKIQQSCEAAFKIKKQ